jgi:peptide/nickel transport system permease protein
LVIFGIAWLMLMLAVAVLADVIAPYAYTALDLRNRLSPPILFGGTWIHPLGTDELGRDVLSRLIYSIRTSLLIAFGATIIGAAVGTSLGFLAAHFRGLVEQAVLALVDFSASLPFLILALAVLAFFGNSLGLLVCLLGLHAWERYARTCLGCGCAGLCRCCARAWCFAVADLWAACAAQYCLHLDCLHDFGLS